jgi:hypothetical protein
MNRPLVAILLLAGAIVSLRAQTVRFQVASGTVTILGTSNIHDWKCSTSALNPLITVPTSAGADLGKSVTSISLSISVKSLDCGNGQMNTNLAKALHADEHPTIAFRLVSYDGRVAATGGYQSTMTGSLTINGIARPVTLTGTARPDGKGALRAEGTTSFSTTDFGIEPVKALLGTIKTGDRVTIQATITGSAPVAVAAAQPPPAVVVAPTSAAKQATPVLAPKKAPRVVTPATPSNATNVAAPARVAGDSVPTAPQRLAPTPRPLTVADTAPRRAADTATVVVAAGEVVAVNRSDTTGALVSPHAAPESAGDVVRRFALPTSRIQHMRPRDQRGLFMFESPKDDTVSYNGFTIQWGAAFTQEMQTLQHRNTAKPVLVAGVNQNELMAIGGGFNNAVANLYLDAQLARGIRVAMTSYLSSRHHSETWVKDGYFQIDASPIEQPLLDLLMHFTTVKLGHFEVDYGDAHFRRTDNGQAMDNPFIGNLILDAFTTEIGGEGYFRVGPILAMAGATGGEIRGQVTGPAQRSPAWLGKLGIDRQLAPDLRVRLTGSTYGSAKSRSNTLYTGDRGGSPYFMVLENTAATETANAWSGNIRPGFANVVHSYMVNPFVKYRATEFFGTIETSTGKASAESHKRTVRQLAGEGIMRFGSADQLYVATRYNRVAGELTGLSSDMSTDRWQFGGGWFVLPTVLAKVEYVVQRYYDFPTIDIRSGGQFKGIVFGGSLAF